MSKKCFQVISSVALISALSVAAVGVSDAFAQVAMPGHHDEGHAGHRHGGDHGSDVGQAATVPQAPHGGQITSTSLHSFEVVYQPRETRVYLYAPDHRPVSARGVRGHLAMRVRGNHQVFRYPLVYVAPPAGSGTQDYLAVAVDVSRIRYADMTATFELADLPNPQQPRATFAQTFALTQTGPRIRVVALSDVDQAGIARQQVCPVMGAKLGSHGTPVKLLVGDRPLYLCCIGCKGRVEQNPEYYMAKAAQVRAGR